VVLSNKIGQGLFYNDFDTAIETLEQDPTIETIFVIGGEMVYRQTINHPKCEKIYLNLVHVVCDLSKSDAFFPNPDPTMYELVESAEIDVTVTKNIYNRIYQ
jgi:dihydrofolate reductase